ncbi:MAG: HNH endonuclease [Armatimonadetes bacterium]|nr:HNH endonuclease [Armatimonadota bacterium]NOG39230.1 HNH endonuclease [Armatimonadota bacterium]GIK33278.1 MAG: hypothetical protein BroJett009_22700 [Armatimonadota bacterium]
MATFDNQTVDQVWNKGQVVANNDLKVWRKDAYGAWMKRTDYGNRNSQYGWEIDHIKPASFGGPDSLSNLRPLQWENNAKKQNGHITSPITSSGVNNTSSQARP